MDTLLAIDDERGIDARMAKSKFTYEYPRPSVTVDAAVYGYADGALRVLLIRRGSNPFAGRWALPGGFVNEDESLEIACKRELTEETGLKASKLWPVGTFGDPGRDPRGWTVSAVYLSVVGPKKMKVAGADDATEAVWHAIDRLPPLAFDHAKILKAARLQLAQLVYVTNVVAPLLPARFDHAQFAAICRSIDITAPTDSREAALRLVLSGAAVIPAEGQLEFAGKSR